MPPAEVHSTSSCDGLPSSPTAQRKRGYDLIPFSILLRRRSREEKFLVYFNHCSYPLSLQLGICWLSKLSNLRQQFPERLALVTNFLLVFLGSSQNRHLKHLPSNFSGTRYKIGPRSADTRLKAARGHRASSPLGTAHQCCCYVGCLRLGGSNSHTTDALGGISSIKAESVSSWHGLKLVLPKVRLGTEPLVRSPRLLVGVILLQHRGWVCGLFCSCEEHVKC